MKKLRIAIIGVVALLVLAALAGPAFTCGIATRQIEAGVAAINQQGQFDASYTRTASGWFFERRADHGPKPAATKQLGVLLASGMIVGESMIGVALAALVVFSGKDAPLALVGPGFAGAAVVIGALAFALVMYAMYAWLLRLARRAA